MRGQQTGAAIFAVVMCVSQLACSGEPSNPVIFDFAAELHQATTTEETRWIDFGQPEARTFLLGGWSVDEKTGGIPASIVWAVGPKSAIRFYRFRTGDQVVRTRMMDQPFVNEPNTISVLVNGELIKSMVSREPTGRVAYREYDFVLPGRVLRQGLNVMEFRYSVYHRPPPGAQEFRQLAISWDYLQFGIGLGDTKPVAVDGNLSMAGVTRLEYVTNIPDDARLQWQSIAPWGDQPVPADARFIATVHRDDGTPDQRIELTAEEFGTAQDIPLTNRKKGVGVISFLALVDETAGGSPKGVTVAAPRLIGEGAGSK